MGMMLNPHRFGAADPGFDPSTITGITAWWDPDDASTVTLSGGTTITQVEDKIGSNHLVQALSLGTPAKATSGGRDWMSFTGGARVLWCADEAASALLFGSGEFSLVAVFKTSGVAAERIINKGSNSTGRYLVALNGGGGAGNYRGFIHDGSSPANSIVGSGSNDGSPHAIAVIRDNSANLLRVRADGAEIGTVSTSGLGDIDETGTANLFSHFLVGAAPLTSSTTTDHFTGQIGEILVFNTALSGTDLSDLETYLESKWSI